jgi:hypothetical protein
MLVACSEVVSVESDLLVARAVDSRLELTNTTSTRVFYFAADRNGLAVLDWAPCVDPAVCDAVAPLSTRNIALEDVALYNPGVSEIAVYHWRLVAVPGEGGYVPDSIRMVVVPVR